MEHKVYKIYNTEDFDRLTRGIKIAQCMRTEAFVEPRCDAEVLGKLDDLSISETLCCSFCSATFEDIAQQRRHYKLDWHRYNLKQRLADRKPISEEAFTTLADMDDVSSISGSESSSEEETDADVSRRATVASRHAKVFFENADGDILSVYRCLMHGKKDAPEKDDMFVPLALKCAKSRKWAILMLGGGHFAAGIFDGGEVVVHKTFHCYTVRKGQGGTQSSRDNRSGGTHPKSAGASLRRYNEAALVQHVQDVTSTWSADLATCDLVFVRASGRNSAVLFGGRNPPLSRSDQRLRTVPFPTRRATFSEVQRVRDVLASIEVYGAAEGFQNAFPQSPRRRAPRSWAGASEEGVGRARGARTSPAIDRAKARRSPVRPLPEMVASLAAAGSSSSVDSVGTLDVGTLDVGTLDDGVLTGEDVEIDLAAELREFDDDIPEGAKRSARKKRKRRLREEEPVDRRRPEVVRLCRGLTSACRAGDRDLLSLVLSGGEGTSREGTALLAGVTREEVLSSLNEPVDELRNRLLHVAAQNGHVKIVRLLLEAGSDPSIKNKKAHPPYVSSCNKGTRDVFRRFFAEYPDKYDYSQSQIPSGLTDELLKEQAEKKRAMKKAKRDKVKQKKKEDELKKEEELEKERFLQLTDREKRALAAERRILSEAARGSGGAKVVVLSRCFLCAADMSGKVPFEYDLHRFCTIECLKAHRAANRTAVVPR